MTTTLVFLSLTLVGIIAQVSGELAYSEYVNLHNYQQFDKVPDECLDICYDLDIVDSGANGWDGGEIKLQVWADYSSETGAPVSDCDVVSDWDYDSEVYNLAHNCDRLGDPYELLSGASETSEICFPDPSISGCEMYNEVCYTFNLADWLDNAGKYDNPIEWWGSTYYDSGEGATADQHAEAGWSLKDPATGDVIAQNTGLSSTSVCVGGVTRAPTATQNCYSFVLSSNSPNYPWDTTLTTLPKEGTSTPGFTEIEITYDGSGSPEIYEVSCRKSNFKFPSSFF